MKKPTARALFAFLCFGGVGIAASAAPDAPAYDLLFRHAHVVDGTGAPWFTADVAVSGGRIAAVGSLDPARAKRVIDASALTVAPGFIDLFSQSEYYSLVDSRSASKDTQGITTEETGEGDSIAALDDNLI